MCSGVDMCHMCAMFGVAQYRDPVGEFVACLHMGGVLTARWEGEDRHSTYNTTQDAYGNPGKFRSWDIM